MSFENNFNSIPPQLDPGLQHIVDADISRGYSTGMGSILASYINANPELVEPGIAIPMADVIDYLTNERSTRQPLPIEQDHYTASRVLAVFDQFVTHPDDLETFLTDQRVAGSVLVANDHLLSVIPIRYWNSGGDTKGTLQLYSFAQNHAEDCAAVQQKFISVLTASMPQNEHDLLRLSSFLTELSTVVLSPEQSEPIQEIIIQIGATVARAQQKEADEIERKIQEESASAERERIYQERQAVIEQIRNQPNEGFGSLLEQSGTIDRSAAASEADSFLLKGASTYLTAVRFDGGDQDLKQAAFNILQAVFDKVFSKDYPSALYYEDFSSLAPHLATLVPDLDALDALLLRTPNLWMDTEFYGSWKQAFIDDRLRKRAAESVDPSVVETLMAEDVSGLKIEIPRLGVFYDNIDDLTEDLRKYFVYGIGDLKESKLIRASELLDDQTGRTTLLASQLSRDDEAILQADVIEPLKGFIEALADSSAQAAYYTFDTEEAKHGGTPYKYEATSFAGYAVSINVAVNGDHRNSYYLDMRGGGYARESYAGQYLAEFAAFTDTQVVYFDESTAKVEVIRGEESRLRSVSDEAKAELEASLLASGTIPTRAPYQHRGETTDDREIWKLPYHKSPHNTAAETIQKILGKRKLQYSIGNTYEDTKTDVTDGTIIPEPQKTFEIQTQEGATGRDKATQSKRVRLSPPANFYATVSNDQANELMNLAYYLGAKSKAVVH